MADRLNEAIQLRADGNLERACDLMLALVAERPADARVNYHTAWTHDALGFERDAVWFYERALVLGLDGDERAGALLGLGSTYRALGDYAAAVSLLRQAVEEFPVQRVMEVFLAMALYNVGEHGEAMERLLQVLADTSRDESIRRYQRAIGFYADKLDETW
jgi:tetratricopeptide (TPR) repeat protein